MLNNTAFRFPFPPPGAVQAELQVAVAGAAPVYTLHAVTGSAPPDPFALGGLPAGASVGLALRWFGADGSQIGDAETATFVLASGPDSELGLTITTVASPVVPQVDAPASGATAAQ